MHRSTVALSIVALAWLSATLLASDPQLGRITPSGGQRGTELDVILSGARLGDTQEILLYYPGIRVVSLEPQKDGNVKARLAIAADCMPGPHALRLRTATGISNLRLFVVDTMPEVPEKEPNSDLAAPQPIPLNVTVTGVVENEDVDYFAVELKKGQRITAEIDGVRLGETFFDPFVAILDQSRFALSEADDTALAQQDAVASAVVPADGKYLVQVRESAFGGSGECRYRLHVGTFPRPLAVYPAGGKPGESLEVRWLGDVAGPRTEKIALPPVPPPMFGLLAADAGGVAPSPNRFRLVDLKNVLEAEPNDTPPQATAAEAPAALNGIIEKPGDVDFFKFKAKAGQAFEARVHGRAIRTPIDSVLTITRSNGAGIGSNDDSDSPDSFIRFTAPADDEYLVSITDQLKEGRPEYVYRIEVTPIQPRLTLGLPERNQYVDVVGEVPSGNRLAVMVSAQREDFGGPVNLEIKDLPPGITAQFDPMGPDESQIPVLFTAAGEAKPAGSLANLIGRNTEGNRTVDGRVRQRSSLVRGDNNREVCMHFADRMAMAVTSPAPFQIEIVEPKVPLVQSGSMELKVLAKRNEGFKAPITLRMLYSPSGVSSPVTVTIPEGQNEVAFPLTSDGGAAVRKWKIAVLGEATVGDGTIMVSSQLANLEVAEPFFKFNFSAAAVEQGQQTPLAIKVDKKKDFAGPAKVELLGLPNEVTAEPKDITKDSAELVFTLKTTANSPAGQHRSLICRAVVTADGQPITHMLGTGELRIQKPLPPKPQTAQAKPEPKPQPKPAPAQPTEKVLSRLEKLRLEKQKK